MSGGWNTIESDAGVFTYLVENLGVKDVQLDELVSLDSESLEQLSPIYGVIFLFKYPTGEQASNAIPPDGTFDFEAAENIFFAAQTIQNACGTQALLSILLNKNDEIVLGSQLQEFKDFTAAFPPELRGEALSNSALIRDVHNTFARASPFIDETPRHASTTDDDVYHFIAYTAIYGTLYELDGLQPAPISHGACPTAAAFPAAVIPVLRRRIERYPAAEIRFNLLAVGRDRRLALQEVGDVEGLEREEARRSAWVWENTLRRHNFVGFVGEVLKGVMRSKVKEGGEAVDKWVEEGRERMKLRLMKAPKEDED